MAEEDKIRENERKVLQELQETELFQRTGQACYLISMKWFQQWSNFVSNSDSERPQEIDNSGLIETFDKDVKLDSENLLILKDNLHEEMDFKVLDSKSWASLLSWYKGGPEIKRLVIEEGESRVKRVEIYLWRINILKSLENGETEELKAIAFYRSKQITLQELQKELCGALELDERKVRLWNAYDVNNFELFTAGQFSETLNDLQLLSGQKVLIEVQLDNGIWPISKERVGFYSRYIRPVFSFTRSLFFSTTESVTSVASTFSIPTLYGTGKAQERGLCGLNNLGNTCFMNSALQCLSHTYPLTHYFLSDAYIHHINKENPLGTRGNLAEQYALLIKALWSGDYGQVAPKNLKWAIGKFAPRFSGYAQQDAQELLAYLLDGLHEDLNQIKQKPYVPIEDSNNRPDEEVSKEHWEKHLMRNKSVIVDQFQAQLKSTLVCPTCGKVSITFDPFMYLSLPLPSTLEVYKFTLFFFDKNIAPITYAVQMPKRSKVSEFKDLITQITKIKSEDLVLVEINNSKISSMARDSSFISSRVDEYHCYEINPDVKNEQFCFVPFNFRKEDLKMSTYTRNKKKIFGYPLLTIVMKSISTRQLYFFIWIKVQRFLREELRDKRLFDITYDHPLHLWTIIEELAKEAQFDPQNLPFTLHSCTLSLFYCIVCKSNCSGCLIEPSEKPVSWHANMAIAIEWKEDQLDQLREDAFNYDLDDSVKKAEEESEKSISLDKCLELFSKEEILSEEDKWYCSNCKDFVRASKKMDLWTSPDILIIHLKRFQSTMGGYREKIDAKLDFPIDNLDLSKYVLKKGDQSLIYDLYAVSIHSGGLHSGHYTAIAKKDGQWYNFNDSSVSTTSNIPARGAYILFYRRRTNESNDIMEIEEETEQVKLSQDVEEEIIDIDASL